MKFLNNDDLFIKIKSFILNNSNVNPPIKFIDKCKINEEGFLLFNNLIFVSKFFALEFLKYIMTLLPHVISVYAKYLIWLIVTFGGLSYVMMFRSLLSPVKFATKLKFLDINLTVFYLLYLHRTDYGQIFLWILLLN